jgi:hypothetical protein
VFSTKIENGIWPIKPNFGLNIRILLQDFLCELITPGDVSNYDKIEVFASGFCPVALVTGQGFVLPGNVENFRK